MDEKKETVRMLGVVLVMLLVGMMAGQGLAAIAVPPGEAEKIEETYAGSGVWEVLQNLNEGIEITASNLTLEGNGYTVSGPGYSDGVTIADKTNVVVTDLNVTGFSQGIYVSNFNSGPEYLGQHHLIGNTVNNNSLYGISILRSESNIIEGNNVSLNDSEGIRLNSYCSDNIIIDNTLDSNVVRGILLNGSCHYNVLSRNIITNNGSGIYLYQSTGNEIYNNDFINNATQVYGSSSYNNIFSMEPPIGGNYWSDWTGKDINGDGLIDDNPRTFTEGTDSHPMLVPYSDRLTLFIDNTIAFFNDCWDIGTITARGKDPDIRLGDFRTILEEARAEIVLGEYGTPCPYLADAMDNCDGEKRDLIIGPGVPELFIMIENLTIALGCQ